VNGSKRTMENSVLMLLTRCMLVDNMEPQLDLDELESVDGPRVRLPRSGPLVPYRLE